MTADAKQPADTLQVHPLAALSEASFDNEIDRNRRLILAQQVYELTQTVAQQAEQITQLQAELAAASKQE